MAAKKKKPPGGATGAPSRSEPRIMLFTKFAGCNFQLAARDFDVLFNTDQEAQTDLMPMLMAIQNNAKIAPFGGIETRQNIVKLFSAPEGRALTGVSTLIGKEIYIASDADTILHGVLDGDGTLDEMTQVGGGIVDVNNTYTVPEVFNYTGTVS